MQRISTLLLMPVFFTGFFIVSCNSSGSNTSSSLTTPPLLIFDAGQMNADFGVGGRSAADTLCQNAFDLLSGTFTQTEVRAFVSFSGIDSIADMPDNYDIPTDQEIYAPNGTKMADGWDDFLTGNLDHSLQDEGIATGHPEWWSGADANGDLGTFHCTNFTSNSSMSYGATGLTNATTNWLSGGGSDPCINPSPYLLCLAY
ncbi:MAG: hypothetical protein R3A80_07180 [Bdellovibrionota bacterium]